MNVSFWVMIKYRSFYRKTNQLIFEYISTKCSHHSGNRCNDDLFETKDRGLVQSNSVQIVHLVCDDILYWAWGYN